MKLIIDIPEEDYNNIEPFLNGETIKGGFNLFKTLEIIKNGTPLDDVTEAISEAYTNTHYMHPEYASGLSYAYGIIDRCIRKAEREVSE